MTHYPGVQVFGPPTQHKIILQLLLAKMTAVLNTKYPVTQ